MDIPRGERAQNEYDIYSYLQSRQFADLRFTAYRGHEMVTYRVPELPGILVRRPTRDASMECLRRTGLIYEELNAHGIPTVPYLPIEIEGEPCVATHEIDGVNLQVLLDTGDTSVIADQIDALWANLASYLLIRKQDKKPYIPNIYTPEQFEFGRFLEDDNLDLWLVHLPVRADTFGITEGYDESILRHIDTVLFMEGSVKQRLEKSRKAIDRALSAFSDPRRASTGRAILEGETA